MKKSKRIDWLNHFLEFIVVIVGIFLAFQLNTCSSERKQQKTIKTHLKEIYKETKDNKMFLDSTIVLCKANQVKLDTALQLISSKRDVRRLNYLSLDLLNMQTSYIRTNAYQSLIQSGDIRYMNDFDQRKDIVNLYEFYKWVDAFNEMSSSTFTKDYFPYLSKNFDFANGRTQERDIYFTKEFTNAVAAYKRMGSTRLEKYKECRKVMESYLEKNNPN